MIDTYTRLLEIVAETGDEKTAHEAVVRLVHHLHTAGRLKMLPTIAHELRKIRARKNACAPVIEVADISYEKEARAGALRAGVETGMVRVNKEILSGWRAHGNGVLVDCSGKCALIDMYKKVIHHG